MPLSLRPTLLVALLTLAGCADQTPASGEADGLPTVDAPAFERHDDGASVPGFAAFRDSLAAIVARRDTAALLATVAPGARLSFGDSAGGPDGFRAMWFGGTPPEGVAVWDRLGSLLTGGSIDEDGAVMIPYASPGAWPDSIDAFSHIAVVPEGDVPVEARAAASDTAAVVARIGSVILPREGAAASGYQGVRTPDGATVYVPEARAMSPVGYRATFFPDDTGAWKLQTLVAGD